MPKGIQLFHQRRGPEGPRVFKKATEDDPTDSAAWSGLGSCYAGLNNPEDAITAYKQAIEANPAGRDLAFPPRQLLRQAWPASRKRLSLTGRRSPSIRSSRRPISTGGGIYARLGRFTEGREAFEAVTRINPEAAPAYFNAGIAYSQLGRFEEAINAQKNVIRLNPDFAPGLLRHRRGLIPARPRKGGAAALQGGDPRGPGFCAGAYAWATVMLLQGGQERCARAVQDPEETGLRHGPGTFSTGSIRTMTPPKNLRELPSSRNHNCFGCSPTNPSGLRMQFFTDGRERLLAAAGTGASLRLEQHRARRRALHHSGRDHELVGHPPAEAHRAHPEHDGGVRQAGTGRRRAGSARPGCGIPTARTTPSRKG